MPTFARSICHLDPTAANHPPLSSPSVGTTQPDKNKNNTMRLLAFFLGALCLAGGATTAMGKKKEDDPKECEVCIKVVGDVIAALDATQLKDLNAIEAEISSYCAKEGLSRQVDKLCYLVDPIKRKVSEPIKNGMRADEVSVCVFVRVCLCVCGSAGCVGADGCSRS